jgi:hypothetical protein
MVKKSEEIKNVNAENKDNCKTCEECCKSICRYIYQRIQCLDEIVSRFNNCNLRPEKSDLKF